MINSSKHILIVGGASGIGRQVTARLSNPGYSLTVTARSSGNTEPEYPGIALQQFDVTNPAHMLDLPEALDAVIYMPGTITLKPFHRLTREDFDRDMEVNFFGAVRVLQQALPALKRTSSKCASIVLFSSVAATTGMPFHASIAAAKAAIEGLGRSLAAELAPNIRVNVIAPSLTDTPLAASLLSDPKRAEAAAKRHPLNRIGDPGEIAELVEFLVSDASRFMTGQVIGIDGGISSVKLF